jgi:hypothetical protein
LALPVAIAALALLGCGGDDDPPSGYYGPATEPAEDATEPSAGTDKPERSRPEPSAKDEPEPNPAEDAPEPSAKDEPARPKPEEESTGGYTGVLANTYEAGRSTCADFRVSETARQLGLPPSSDAFTVAQEYGTQLSTGEHIQASADGCLAGLEQSP